MNKTGIEWADMTWNPVTGCLHGCEYCYARGFARRFEGHAGYVRDYGKNGLHDLDVQAETKNRYGDYVKARYPFGFDPTFHRYRLDEPARKKKPSTIFVGSMCDLFGDWVPDEWIKAVFEACEAAPQHRYLFLTKNPERFQNTLLTQTLKISSNMWFGFSVSNQKMLSDMVLAAQWLPANSFISIEPIHEAINLTRIAPTGKDAYIDLITGNRYWFMGGDRGKKLTWIIIGAETGNRKGKVIPRREWVESIVENCRATGTPVFMKDSLIPIMGEENMLREFPWEATP